LLSRDAKRRATMCRTDAVSGTARFNLIGWLGLYRFNTLGVCGSVRPAIRMGDELPQPDALLRILESHGGRCRVTSDRYLEGGPELIAEVSRTTADDDLGVKRDLYRRFGVQEYIVWRVADRAVDWFALRGGYYFPLAPGPDGIVRSEVFPAFGSIRPLSLVVIRPSCWPRPNSVTAAPNTPRSSPSCAAGRAKREAALPPFPFTASHSTPGSRTSRSGSPGRGRVPPPSSRPVRVSRRCRPRTSPPVTPRATRA
jgi:Uma2 family endonuclease